MDNYTLTEQAYKNGYEQGLKDAHQDMEIVLNEAVKTNADRIRAMTDEELALFFGRLGFCSGIIPRSHCHAHKVCGQGCVVDWLKQPAEV